MDTLCRTTMQNPEMGQPLPFRSSLFLSVTGVRDVTSDFDCPVEDDTLRLLLIAAVSMALNSLPRLFFWQLGFRNFSEGAGDKEKVRKKWRQWLVADTVFWLLSFLWQAGYILFLCAFLASLAPADESKCLLCFGTILVAKFFASPFSRMLGRAWKGMRPPLGA